MATAKKTETKAAAVNTELKPEAAAEGKKAEPEKVAEVKIEAETKKTEAPKKAAPAKKAAVPKKEAAPKKETVKKVSEKKEIHVNAFVQYAEKEVSMQELTEKIKEAYAAGGRKAEDIQSIEIYVKPEEGVAYYVVNNEGSQDFKVSL